MYNYGIDFGFIFCRLVSSVVTIARLQNHGNDIHNDSKLISSKDFIDLNSKINIDLVGLET